MQKFFKIAALVVAVYCLTWLVALWLWQKQGREVSAEDLALYLGILPLVITMFIFGFRWAFAVAMSSVLTNSANATPGAQVGRDPFERTLEESERYMSSVVLAAAANTVIGTEVSDLLEAIKSGKSHPVPDESLLCDAGLPILTARCKSVSDGEWASELVAVVAQVAGQQSDWVGLEPRTSIWRALSLLGEPVTKVREALLGLLVDQASANSEAFKSAQELPRQSVRLLFGFPEVTSEFERTCFLGWAEHLLTADWPAGVPGLKLDVTPFQGTAEGLMVKIDQILLAYKREKREDLLVVVGCESLLDHEAVERLEGQGRLYNTDERPSGVMPGEAAVVLLLGGEAWARQSGSEQPSIVFHRPTIKQREKSIEAGGRSSSTHLVQVMQDALAVSTCEVGEIASLVSDADQHTQRATELFGGALELLPHLDPVEDFWLLGRSTGSVGMASGIMAFVAGVEVVGVTNKPCLVLSQGGQFVRLGWVLRPAPGR